MAATALLRVSDNHSWSAALLLIAMSLVTVLASALAPRLSLNQDKAVTA